MAVPGWKERFIVALGACLAGGGRGRQPHQTLGSLYFQAAFALIFASRPPPSQFCIAPACSETRLETLVQPSCLSVVNLCFTRQVQCAYTGSGSGSGARMSWADALPASVLGKRRCLLSQQTPHTTPDHHDIPRSRLSVASESQHAPGRPPQVHRPSACLPAVEGLQASTSHNPVSRRHNSRPRHASLHQTRTRTQDSAWG
ncbi:hypothetical protein B0J15DRAFT_524236 [Fusarium solani]|uniref:Uncharacterized protein n=1 Tax=Fusarium solani TaxID=169388 RepID=A0A9P9KIB4_FUSSL|nr:uncharacterized protein B0J15DRAFT_524236 [Fusarium solani]KAH7264057.1 hypothetical protein B0J15DRAFT_524236 [Fusarium solani]